jgi:signal transduction histidine kinase
MLKHGFSLPPHQLEQLFPFHLVLNKNLEIVQLGRSLARLYPELSLGSPIEHHFQIEHPTLSISFDAIREQSNSFFLLASRHNGMQLRGQIEYVEESNVIFFVGSPWITDLADLALLGLDLNDFAIHEPVADFLCLLQTQNTAISQAGELANKLNKQQAQLREAICKAEQAAAAQEQARQLKQALEELQQTQTQLIQSEKMSSLGQLVAGIAHEINNPVNFIIGNLEHVRWHCKELLHLVELYQKHCLATNPEIQAYTEEIDLNFLREDLPKILSSMKVGASRIHEIVLNLRNFSRIDEAEMKPVNIHEGIDNSLLLLQHRLKATTGASEVAVIKEYGELPLVECYAGQLNQVFMHVLNNALDALEEFRFGQSTPTIKIRTEVPYPNAIQIKIADNGAGIPKDIQERIFDPFFTTKPIGQGTGLGLSISYQIVVQKHRGTLQCVTAPERGTEFTIEIPVRQNAAVKNCT